jgi:SAM-dependent methyltransferase
MICGKSLMKSSELFDVQQYWRTLVKGGNPSDVDEVGHPDMGRAFNNAAYELRLKALQRALQQAGVELSQTSVFEAAYGVGYYLRFWANQHCPRVVGVDLSAQAHANVQRHFPAFDLRVGDLASLHHSPEWAALVASFQLVTAIDVIYHIVDEAAARQAVENLARLVARGGILCVTEKFPARPEPVREGEIAVRRPLAWYSQAVAAQGLVLERTVPIFWCMDPPVFHGGQHWTAGFAYLGWGAMRLLLKFWPRNHSLQNALGYVVGMFGKTVDGLVVPRMATVPNLTTAVFRKV